MTVVPVTSLPVTIVDDVTSVDADSVMPNFDALRDALNNHQHSEWLDTVSSMTSPPITSPTLYTLDAAAGAGATTVTVDRPPELSPVGYGYLIVDAYNSAAELRKATLVDDATVTVAALDRAHPADAMSLWVSGTELDGAWFGIRPDDPATPVASMVDNTAALLALVAASKVTKGAMRLPPGVVRYTQTLEVLSAQSLRGGGGLSIKGAATDPPWSPSTTLLWDGAAGGTMIHCDQVQGVTFAGLALDGNFKAGKGMHLRAFQASHVGRVAMRNFGSQNNPAVHGLCLHVESVAGQPINTHMTTFEHLMLSGATLIRLDGDGNADTCITTFRRISGQFGSGTGNEDGIDAYVADNIDWDELYVFRNFGTGAGIRLRSDARNHYFHHPFPSLGGLRCETPSFAGWANRADGYQRGDGAPPPSLAPGARLIYSEDGINARGWFIEGFGQKFGVGTLAPSLQRGGQMGEHVLGAQATIYGRIHNGTKIVDSIADTGVLYDVGTNVNVTGVGISSACTLTSIDSATQITLSLNSTADSPLLTGDTTIDVASITNLADTSALRVGAPVTGPNIPVGTTVTSVAASSVGLSAKATATATGQSFQFWSQLVLSEPAEVKIESRGSFTAAGVETLGRAGAGAVVRGFYGCGGAAFVDFGSLTAHGARVLANGTAAVTIGSSGDTTFAKKIAQKRVALTFAANIAVDGSLGNEFDITVSTISTPFTVLNPTNLTDGQQLTFTIVNTSSGALGAATWGTTFKLAAWTQPAAGFSRSITFRHNGTNLVEISRTPADVPN